MSSGLTLINTSYSSSQQSAVSKKKMKMSNTTVKVSNGGWVPWVIIGVLCVLLFMARECGRPDPPVDPEPPSVVIDTIIDTVYLDTIVEKPVPVIVHDSFPVFIDTGMVVDDYYKYRVYKVKLKNDSSAKLDLFADVYMNELQDVKLSGTIYNKVIIRTETVEKLVAEKRRKVFAGAQISSAFSVQRSGFGDSELQISPGLAVGLMYQSKKDHAYSLSYDPFNKAVTGTFWYKISFRKKERP